LKTFTFFFYVFFSFGMKAWPGQQKLGQPPVFGNMDLLTFSDIWVKTSQFELASKSCRWTVVCHWQKNLSYL